MAAPEMKTDRKEYPRLSNCCCSQPAALTRCGLGHAQDREEPARASRLAGMPQVR